MWRALAEGGRAGAPSADAALRLRSGRVCGPKKSRVCARDEARRPRRMALEVGGAVARGTFPDRRGSSAPPPTLVASMLKCFWVDLTQVNF